MEEIREYEDQLAEIRKELESSENEELRIVEEEIVGLISELKSNLPAFQEDDEVSTKSLIGKVLKPIGSKMYMVQPYNKDGKPDGDIAVIDESALQATPLPNRPILKKKEKDEKATERYEEPAINDEFEEKKSKWKQFTKKTKTRSVMGTASKVSKQPAKRTHFTHKK